MYKNILKREVTGLERPMMTKKKKVRNSGIETNHHNCSNTILCHSVMTFFTKTETNLKWFYGWEKVMWRVTEAHKYPIWSKYWVSDPCVCKNFSTGGKYSHLVLQLEHLQNQNQKLVNVNACSFWERKIVILRLSENNLA